MRISGYSISLFGPTTWNANSRHIIYINPRVTRWTEVRSRIFAHSLACVQYLYRCMRAWRISQQIFILIMIDDRCKRHHRRIVGGIWQWWAYVCGYDVVAWMAYIQMSVFLLFCESVHGGLLFGNQQYVNIRYVARTGCFGMFCGEDGIPVDEYGLGMARVITDIHRSDVNCTTRQRMCVARFWVQNIHGETETAISIESTE